MNCCDDYTGECKQGHGCPARETHVNELPKQAFTHYCDSQRQPCPQPYQCGHICIIDGAKLQQRSGGATMDDGMPIKMFDAPRRVIEPSLYWFVVAGAVIGFGIGIYQHFGN